MFENLDLHLSIGGLKAMEILLLRHNKCYREAIKRMGNMDDPSLRLWEFRTSMNRCVSDASRLDVIAREVGDHMAVTLNKIHEDAPKVAYNAAVKYDVIDKYEENVEAFDKIFYLYFPECRGWKNETRYWLKVQEFYVPDK